jgi:hypothetical protein
MGMEEPDGTLATTTTTIHSPTNMIDVSHVIRINEVRILKQRICQGDTALVFVLGALSPDLTETWNAQKECLSVYFIYDFKCTKFQVILSSLFYA